ncbi:hypothetical protein [Paenarthrobacter ilicis]|uniref:hypothetical protein n=1 Tax=Paenarthrobacter ilicis TaxID=43665 RepID=UPI0028D42010|nr:hypothetical protein [Paenarthrobacter ilicis]
MARIMVTENCGNAPKQAFVLDFLRAVVSGSPDQALTMVTDDIQIQIVGRETLTGRASLSDRLQTARDRTPVQELEVLNVISHGKWCSSNGSIRFADNTRIGFNNLYTFSGHGKNALLQRIEIYAVAELNAR